MAACAVVVVVVGQMIVILLLLIVDARLHPRFVVGVVVVEDALLGRAGTFRSHIDAEIRVLVLDVTRTLAVRLQRPATAPLVLGGRCVRVHIM